MMRLVLGEEEKAAMEGSRSGAVRRSDDGRMR